MPATQTGAGTTPHPRPLSRGAFDFRVFLIGSDHLRRPSIPPPLASVRGLAFRV